MIGEGLAIVPEHAFAYSHLSVQCDALPTQVLLRNLSASDLELSGFSVTSDLFQLSPLSLPKVIAPGGSAPIAVSYVGTNEEGEEATVRILTSEGCADFHIQGVATRDSAVTTSDAAIDFGSLAPGDSLERLYQIRYQRAADFAQTELFGFTVGPSPPFELVNSPTGVVRPESCTSVGLTVRFTAPVEPGPVEGILQYLVATELPGGTAEGVVLISLFGNAGNGG